MLCYHTVAAGTTLAVTILLKRSLGLSRRMGTYGEEMGGKGKDDEE